MGNFIVGLIIALVGINVFKGDKEDAGIRQNGSNSSDSGNSGSQRSDDQKHNRASATLTQKERIERLKLKKARLQYMAAKLEKTERKKDETVIKKQPDVTGSVAPDNPGTESDGPNGQVTVTEIKEV